MNAPTGRWLRCPRPRPDATTRLICLPHAGGSASAYRSWPELLDDHLEVHLVQYPGREDRFGEPFVDDLTAVVDHLADELAHLTTGRYAVFGHSMGAAIAYELVARLVARGRPAPVHLFVSGRQPPRHHRTGTVHTRGDDELGAELMRLSPLNADLLGEPELAALILPIVRSDYRLIERYRPGPPVRLPVPITALIGAEDHELTEAEARDWAEHTDRGLRLRTYPGDHFFLVDQRAAVVQLLSATLRPTRPHPVPNDPVPNDSVPNDSVPNNPAPREGTL